MPSSVYQCVKPEDIQKLTRAASDYKKIGTLGNVKAAGRKAGQYLAGQMTKLVEGESSLSAYQDVGRAFTVFEDQNNMVAGIGPTSRLIAKAWQMHNIYQVKDAAYDLAKQSGDVEEIFYEALFDVVMK